MVARAGHQTLTDRRLSELMVLAQPVPLTADVAYQLASFWVTYAAFAQRAAAGDSLLDSATVMRLMAHRARQEVVSAWRGRLLARLTSAQAARFDSAYARALVEGRHAELTAGAAARIEPMSVASETLTGASPRRSPSAMGGAISQRSSSTFASSARDAATGSKETMRPM